MFLVKHAFLSNLKKIQVLFCCFFVLMVLGYLFLAVKTEVSLSAFMSLPAFCLAGGAKMGNTTNMFIPHLFLTIITEVGYVAYVTCSNFFFAFCTKSRYITDVTIPNFFFAIVAKEC